MEKQGARNSKINFKKKKKTAEDNTLYNVYVFFITAVIKSVGYWQRGRHIDKWNRRVNPEIDSHKYAQLILNKGSKAIQWRKGSIFNNGNGTNEF